MVIFVLTFAISLCICNAFLKQHYSHDTYKIIDVGYEAYAFTMFLREARPISAILTMLANYINLPINIYIVASFVGATAILSISVMILYFMFAKKIGEVSIGKKIVLFVICYITIFSYLTIEHIYFLEACVMALGILLSVLASKTIVNSEKYG